MDNHHPTLSRVEANQQAQKNRKHPLRWIFGTLVVILLGLAAYVGYLYYTVQDAGNSIQDPSTSVKVNSKDFDGKKKFAVLLLGTDTGALGRTEKRGNTDTVIVAVVNPAKKRYTLMSIPRDTMAQMIGTDEFEAEKINAAYSIGGAKMAMKTVSRLLNVPIKYYSLVNMGGLVKIVDYLGGITVKPPLSFSYNGASFTKGKKTKVNGGQALSYARMRYDDPQGDYGRQIRQREVITQIIKSAATWKTLTNLSNILSSVKGNVRTNISFNALVAIFRNYQSSTKHSESDYLHGYPAYIGDAAYQVTSTKELQRVSNKLRKELGLKAEQLDNNETYQNARNEANGFSFKSTNTQNYNIYPYSGQKTSTKKTSTKATASKKVAQTTRSTSNNTGYVNNSANNSSAGYLNNYANNSANTNTQQSQSQQGTGESQASTNQSAPGQSQSSQTSEAQHDAENSDGGRR